MEKIELSCSFCSAEFEILHDLSRPYSVSCCPFCGEDIKEEDDWGKFDDEYDDEYDDEFDDYDSY